MFNYLTSAISETHSTVSVASAYSFRVPWFQYPIIYDIRARPKLLTSPTGSKDLQMVNMGLRVLHRPDQYELPSMYRRLGLDYDERVLPSICNEVRVYNLRFSQS